jgi:hypothetical protein
VEDEVEDEEEEEEEEEEDDYSDDNDSSSTYQPPINKRSQKKDESVKEKRNTRLNPTEGPQYQLNTLNKPTIVENTKDSKKLPTKLSSDIKNNNKKSTLLNLDSSKKKNNYSPSLSSISSLTSNTSLPRSIQSIHSNSSFNSNLAEMGESPEGDITPEEENLVRGIALLHDVISSMHDKHMVLDVENIKKEVNIYLDKENITPNEKDLYKEEINRILKALKPSWTQLITDKFINNLTQNMFTSTSINAKKEREYKKSVKGILYKSFLKNDPNLRYIMQIIGGIGDTFFNVENLFAELHSIKKGDDLNDNNSRHFVDLNIKLNDKELEKVKQELEKIEESQKKKKTSNSNNIDVDDLHLLLLALDDLSTTLKNGGRIKYTKKYKKYKRKTHKKKKHIKRKTHKKKNT